MAVLYFTKKAFTEAYESKLSKKEIAGAMPGTTFTIDDDQICLLPERIVVAKNVEPVVKEKKEVVKDKKQRAPRKSKSKPDITGNEWFTGLAG